MNALSKMNMDDKQKKTLNIGELYHEYPLPGKISSIFSKPLTPLHLKQAYSPHVAQPCIVIAKDSKKLHNYYPKKIAIISNGTAVLGLGNIGAHAGIPVMEGKALLLKQFGGLEAESVVIDCLDPDLFIKHVQSIACNFAGINLEDIKAPECFKIEEILQNSLNIPIFHDDQHGTAVVVLSAVLSFIHHTQRKIEDIKLVMIGSGASGLASLNLLNAYGLKKDNIFVFDSKGIVSTQRTFRESYRDFYAQDLPDDYTIAQALNGADIFIGCSGPNTVDKNVFLKMNKNPLIIPLANPVPEVSPVDIFAVRSDAFVGTGRADYPNQINNSLCFPFLFRALIDSHTQKINTNDKIFFAKLLSEYTLAQNPNDNKILVPSMFDTNLADYLIKNMTNYFNQDKAMPDPILYKNPTIPQETYKITTVEDFLNPSTILKEYTEQIQENYKNNISSQLILTQKFSMKDFDLMTAELPMISTHIYIEYYDNLNNTPLISFPLVWTGFLTKDVLVKHQQLLCVQYPACNLQGDTQAIDDLPWIYWNAYTNFCHNIEKYNSNRDKTILIPSSLAYFLNFTQNKKGFLKISGCMCDLVWILNENN